MIVLSREFFSPGADDLDVISDACADQHVVRDCKAVNHRKPNRVRKLRRCRSGATLRAIDCNEVRLDPCERRICVVFRFGSCLMFAPRLAWQTIGFVPKGRGANAAPFSHTCDGHGLGKRSELLRLADAQLCAQAKHRSHSEVSTRRGMHSNCAPRVRVTPQKE